MVLLWTNIVDYIVSVLPDHKTIAHLFNFILRKINTLIQILTYRRFLSHMNCGIFLTKKINERNKLLARVKNRFYISFNLIKYTYFAINHIKLPKILLKIVTNIGVDFVYRYIKKYLRNFYINHYAHDESIITMAQLKTIKNLMIRSLLMNAMYLFAIIYNYQFQYLIWMKWIRTYSNIR